MRKLINELIVLQFDEMVKQARNKPSQLSDYLPPRVALKGAAERGPFMRRVGVRPVPRKVKDMLGRVGRRPDVPRSSYFRSASVPFFLSCIQHHNRR